MTWDTYDAIGHAVEWVGLVLAVVGLLLTAMFAVSVGWGGSVRPPMKQSLAMGQLSPIMRT